MVTARITPAPPERWALIPTCQRNKSLLKIIILSARYNSKKVVQYCFFLCLKLKVNWFCIKLFILTLLLEQTNILSITEFLNKTQVGFDSIKFKSSSIQVFSIKKKDNWVEWSSGIYLAHNQSNICNVHSSKNKTFVNYQNTTEF